jgi:hypothetical protein
MPRDTERKTNDNDKGSDSNKEGDNDEVKQKKGPRDVSISWATGKFLSFLVSFYCY